jgi:hypothetical protein
MPTKKKADNPNSSAALEANKPRRQTQRQRISDRLKVVPSTRDQLSHDLGMPIQSVCPNVDALIRSGEIHEEGNRETSNGCAAAVLYPGPGNTNGSISGEHPHP